ncbi:hypothetical protein CHLNCDRAFT_29462 [Chlorella variabilis]|uniref:AMP-dependent synthetase/ligase domain-containing protein n=1 Tax=Chlorella variabilis TaxID=554065 RepID=E1Z493_CHLVA|nr:hypothetical protein CHLNCDRAFT_29462 [Chlorella variabilis]EFN59012.1 hypothetical protein CHLNCDRAFT_29462 [Chlorella variabilis]|eukprot:XP_005851114.1 hypothetical protein CHLNCDRAFT_29462 [Chlorella variabilis]
MEVLRSSLTFSPRTALVAGRTAYRYADLVSSGLAACRQMEASGPPPPPATPGHASTRRDGPRVALFCDPGVDYVAGMYAAWMHGGIAVPLAAQHPDRELSYVLEDAECSTVLVSEQHAERLHSLAQPLGAEVIVVEAQAAAPEGEEEGAAVQQRLEGQQAEDGALIIYTSGTTGKPKGALHSHGSLAAQIGTLCAAWQWQQQDRILHTLPLHHIHGIVNALLCPLYSGACVEMVPKFMPTDVWQPMRWWPSCLLASNIYLQRTPDAVSVFMGVPTMYSQLLSLYDSMPPSEQQEAEAAAKRLRLTVSGSAACPTPIMQRWEQLSGERLFAGRPGLPGELPGTSSGHSMSCGERRPGAVGQPFPGVEARIADKDGGDAGAGPGELRVKSAQLFREYWKRPEATAETFDEQGYFMTGDTAVLEEGGYFRLLGRTSVDVIKSGGYKISALHIESVLLEHPKIAEAAVMGLADQAYGEVIAAVVALKPAAQAAQPQPEAGSAGAAPTLSLPELRAWLKEHLPPYQLPRRLKVVEAIPRNQMGKVNKKELRAALFPAKSAT